MNLISAETKIDVSPFQKRFFSSRCRHPPIKFNPCDRDFVSYRVSRIDIFYVSFTLIISRVQEERLTFALEVAPFEVEIKDRPVRTIIEIGGERVALQRRSGFIVVDAVLEVVLADDRAVLIPDRR